MSRSVAFGLVLAIGALALFALWLAPSARRVAEGIRPAGIPAPELAEPREPLISPRTEEVVEHQGKAPAEPEEQPTRRAQRSQLHDESPRISGRVEVPGDFLPEEAVLVHAEVTPMSGEGEVLELAALAAADGSFSLAVPASTDFAWLSLESRFLALPTPVKARPGEEGVLLDPCVYAAIEGEVVLPRSLPTLEVSWADMKVSWSLDPPKAILCTTLSPSRDKPARPDHDWAFVLSHVPAGIEFELHAENPFGPEWFQHVGPLEPAEAHRLVIELEPGITVSGRVIDEHGRPVEGVEVSTDDEDEHPDHAWCTRPESAPTDSEGRFVLARMPSTVVQVQAQEWHLLARGAEATVDGTAGDVRDLVLAVVRGGCIEGTVSWSDGSPVDGFELRARGPDYKVEDLRDGRFRLCGLSDGRYRVDVRALRGEVVGTAHLVDVLPGAAPIEVRLIETRVFRVQGVVLDEKEAPLETFSVRASPLAPEGQARTADESRDGTFVLARLEPGEWMLEAEARGFQSSRQRIVVGEGSPPPLRIVLRGAGRIRGRVVDPTGTPVADAWVGEEEDAFMLAFTEPGNGSTDSEGSFELRPSSTRARILAGKRGLSPSEIQECEVGPGETIEGVVLRLREGCRVEGRVLDEHGDPLSGIHVSSDWVSAETDPGGGFELDGLPPGVAVLCAFDPQRDSMATLTVTLTPGQPAFADLRFEKPDPVLVHGQVTRGGRPVECALGLRASGFFTECTSGPNGRFEVVLQRPGHWKGAVFLKSDPSWPDLARCDVRRFEVTVPDTDEHAFELDFDALPRLTSIEELFR